jgi:hypothetical protein
MITGQLNEYWTAVVMRAAVCDWKAVVMRAAVCDWTAVVMRAAVWDWTAVRLLNTLRNFHLRQLYDY